MPASVMCISPNYRALWFGLPQSVGEASICRNGVLYVLGSFTCDNAKIGALSGRRRMGTPGSLWIAAGLS